MSIKIPTLTELYDQILNNIATEFGVDVSELGTTYKVWAKVKAANDYSLYLFLSRVQKNIYYDTADLETLQRYGVQILGRLPLPATQGEYTIQVTGSIGAVIPQSTQFIGSTTSKSPGAVFVTDTEITLTSNQQNISIRALEAGLDSLLIVDNIVELVSPNAGVVTEATVVSVDVNPTNAESTESYRDSIIQAAIIEPQGGSPGDFRLWCLEVGEIRTVYVYAKVSNAGAIEIYVEATPENTAPAEITGVPTQATLDQVYKAPTPTTPESGVVVINDQGKGRKPIGVYTISSLSVKPIKVDIFITGLSNEDLGTDIRTAIEALLYDIRPFVAGADIIGNRNDTLTIGKISNLISTVLEGTGATYTDVSMEVDAVAVNSKQFLFGNYPYLRLLQNDGGDI